MLWVASASLWEIFFNYFPCKKKFFFFFNLDALLYAVGDRLQPLIHFDPHIFNLLALIFCVYVCVCVLFVHFCIKANQNVFCGGAGEGARVFNF